MNTKSKQRLQSISNEPLLDTIKVSPFDTSLATQYPFSLPLIQNLKEIEFPTKVTFFVGENGTGKSTILEALAIKAGFGPEGGSKNIAFQTASEKNYHPAAKLADCLTLSWRKKVFNGYFFRAESFFNVATHIEQIAQYDFSIYDSYGGKSLHEQSHGESFLAFFTNRLSSGGFFIFDEPEAALSPQRQLSLLSIIHELSTKTDSQFIIATHSPIILAYPGATIYSCDSGTLTRVEYKDTDHYQITKQFLDNPDRYFTYLFEE
jgi:predicted ATPase